MSAPPVPGGLCPACDSIYRKPHYRHLETVHGRRHLGATPYPLDPIGRALCHSLVLAASRRGAKRPCGPPSRHTGRRGKPLHRKMHLPHPIRDRLDHRPLSARLFAKDQIRGRGDLLGTWPFGPSSGKLSSIKLCKRPPTICPSTYGSISASKPSRPTIRPVMERQSFRLYTTGLEALGQTELEVPRYQGNPQQLLELAYNVAHYLIDRRKVSTKATRSA